MRTYLSWGFFFFFFCHGMINYHLFCGRQAHRQRIIDTGRSRTGIPGPRFRTVCGCCSWCKHFRRTRQPCCHIRSLCRRAHVFGKKCLVLDSPVPWLRGCLPASEVLDRWIGKIRAYVHFFISIKMYDFSKTNLIVQYV